MKLIIRDVTFEVPVGYDADHASDINEIADVIAFHDGKLILRNCHVNGALSFAVDSRKNVMIITGLADTTVTYEPPTDYLHHGEKDFPVDGALVTVALHGDRPTGAGGRWLSVTIS